MLEGAGRIAFRPAAQTCIGASSRRNVLARDYNPSTSAQDAVVRARMFAYSYTKSALHSELLSTRCDKSRCSKRAVPKGLCGVTEPRGVLSITAQEVKDVFRVDLSGVVSKYATETEKNLSRVFDKAEGNVGFCFSTRPMRSSVSAPTSVTHTIDMPTGKSPIYCNVSRTTTG